MCLRMWVVEDAVIQQSIGAHPWDMEKKVVQGGRGGVCG